MTLGSGLPHGEKASRSSEHPSDGLRNNGEGARTVSDGRSAVREWCSSKGARVPGKAIFARPTSLFGAVSAELERGARPSVHGGGVLRSSGGVDSTRIGPPAREVSAEAFGERVRVWSVWQQRFGGRDRAVSFESPNSEPTTVRILSGWGATIPERAWSQNRRGGEKPRGRQSSGSTWRWPLLGESCASRVSDWAMSGSTEAGCPFESESSGEASQSHCEKGPTREGGSESQGSGRRTTARRG